MGFTDYDGFVSRFRSNRFRTVLGMIEGIVAERGRCRVIDVGGEYGYWAPFRAQLAGLPIEVVIANVGEMTERFDDPRFSYASADARDMGAMPDGAFDLAHSNSVIEHVGHWREMSATAAEIRRVARAYYVQTPYYWFPFEPHYKTVGYHWLPEQWRARLHTRRPLGFFPVARDFDQAMTWTQHAVLLDRLQMSTLFPDARIESEKVFRLTKSLIAIRDGAGSPAGARPH